MHRNLKLLGALLRICETVERTLANNLLICNTTHPEVIDADEEADERSEPAHPIGLSLRHLITRGDREVEYGIDIPLDGDDDPYFYIVFSEGDQEVYGLSYQEGDQTWHENLDDRQVSEIEEFAQKFQDGGVTAVEQVVFSQIELRTLSTVEALKRIGRYARWVVNTSERMPQAP